MGKLYNFLLGVAVGFGLYHAASNYHLVYAADGLHLVQKTPPRLSQAYVDVRSFDLADWRDHPQLIVALEKSGKRHIITDAAGGAVEDLLQQGIDRVLPPAQ